LKEVELRTALILTLALSGFALPAIGQDQPTPHLGRPVTAAPDDIRGEALATRWCAPCHLPGANGKVTDAAPTFHAVAALARKDPDSIRTFLARPHAPMPPLELDRGQIADLVAYFQKLANRELPEPRQ